MPVAVRIARSRFTAMWVSHVHGDEIAAHFGIDRSTVTKLAKRYGLTLRTERKVARWVIPLASSGEFVAMWQAVVKTSDMALHFGCHRRTIEHHAKRIGLTARGKGSPFRAITLAEYHELQLREAMARDAQKCWVQFKAAEMLDGRQDGRWPIGRAAA